jgi:hypothetical protein
VTPENLRKAAHFHPDAIAPGRPAAVRNDLKKSSKKEVLLFL